MISLSNYQKLKKSYVCRIAESDIKKNLNLLRPDTIPAIRLGIFHVFVRVYPRKKRTKKKKE